VNATFCETLEWLRCVGAAPLPAPYGMKGTVVPHWPTIPEDLAFELTKAWARGVMPEDVAPDLRDWTQALTTDERVKFLRSWREYAGEPINVAARTGPRLGCVDIDTKDGASEVLKLFPEQCPVVESARGFHAFFKPRRPIGNGTLSCIKGEFFTAPHLVMLPPSRHPSGVNYKWLRLPR